MPERALAKVALEKKIASETRAKKVLRGGGGDEPLSRKQLTGCEGQLLTRRARACVRACARSLTRESGAKELGRGVYSSSSTERSKSAEVLKCFAARVRALGGKKGRKRKGCWNLEISRGGYALPRFVRSARVTLRRARVRARRAQALEFRGERGKEGMGERCVKICTEKDGWVIGCLWIFRVIKRLCRGSVCSLAFIFWVLNQIYFWK